MSQIYDPNILIHSYCMRKSNKKVGRRKYRNNMTRRKMRGGHYNMKLYNIKDDNIYHTFTVLQNQFDTLTKEFNKVDFLLKSFKNEIPKPKNVPGSYFTLGRTNV